MNYDNLLMREPELSELQQEAEELNIFIQTEILPLKEAYQCYGMETVDYEKLGERISELRQYARECINDYMNTRGEDTSPQFRKSFMLYYYMENSDVLELSNDLKNLVVSMSIRNCRPFHNYLLDRNMDSFYFNLNTLCALNIRINGVEYYDLTTFLHEEDYIDFFDALEKLKNIQDTFYRYYSPIQEQYRFSKFDDLLNSILERNKYILSAYHLRDLIHISSELARQRNQADMVALRDYLTRFLD